MLPLYSLSQPWQLVANANKWCALTRMWKDCYTFGWWSLAQLLYTWILCLFNAWVSACLEMTDECCFVVCIDPLHLQEKSVKLCRFPPDPTATMLEYNGQCKIVLASAKINGGIAWSLYLDVGQQTDILKYSMGSPIYCNYNLKLMPAFFANEQQRKPM